MLSIEWKGKKLYFSSNMAQPRVERGMSGVKRGRTNTLWEADACHTLLGLSFDTLVLSYIVPDPLAEGYKMKVQSEILHVFTNAKRGT